MVFKKDTCICFILLILLCIGVLQIHQEHIWDEQHEEALLDAAYGTTAESQTNVTSSTVSNGLKFPQPSSLRGKDIIIESSAQPPKLPKFSNNISDTEKVIEENAAPHGFHVMANTEFDRMIQDERSDYEWKNDILSSYKPKTEVKSKTDDKSKAPIRPIKKMEKGTPAPPKGSFNNPIAIHLGKNQLLNDILGDFLNPEHHGLNKNHNIFPEEQIIDLTPLGPMEGDEMGSLFEQMEDAENRALKSIAKPQQPKGPHMRFDPDNFFNGLFNGEMFNDMGDDSPAFMTSGWMQVPMGNEKDDPFFQSPWLDDDDKKKAHPRIFQKPEMMSIIEEELVPGPDGKFQKKKVTKKNINGHTVTETTYSLNGEKNKDGELIDSGVSDLMQDAITDILFGPKVGQESKPQKSHSLHISAAHDHPNSHDAVEEKVAKIQDEVTKELENMEKIEEEMDEELKIENSDSSSDESDSEKDRKMRRARNLAKKRNIPVKKDLKSNDGKQNDNIQKSNEEGTKKSSNVHRRLQTVDDEKKDLGDQKMKLDNDKNYEKYTEFHMVPRQLEPIENNKVQDEKLNKAIKEIIKAPDGTIPFQNKNGFTEIVPLAPGLPLEST